MHTRRHLLILHEPAALRAIAAAANAQADARDKLRRAWLEGRIADVDAIWMGQEIDARETSDAR